MVCVIVVLFGMGWVIVIADHYDKMQKFKPFCQELGYETATDTIQWEPLYTNETILNDNIQTWKVECDNTEMFRIAQQKTCQKYNKWDSCEKYEYTYYEVKE